MLTFLIGDHSVATVIFVCLAAFVAGMARGFAGFGGALIFVPLASAALTPVLAVPLFLVSDGVSALSLLPNAWRTGDKKTVFTMAVGMLVGVPLGGWLLVHSDPVPVRWGIAITVGAMLALLMSGWRYRGRIHAATTVGVGVASGVLSGLAQIGGTLAIAYWLGGTSQAKVVRANLVLFFAATTVTVVADYVLNGVLTKAVLLLAVVVAPFYGFGLFAGAQMFGKAEETVYRRIAYALIAVAVILSLPVWHGALH